jgi:hypothetical protein
MFVLFLFLGACSSGEDQVTPDKPKNDHILKEQMRALEKAREVEQMLQDGADKRKQTMEEQSR